jgi:hypothetical protein
MLSSFIFSSFHGRKRSMAHPTDLVRRCIPYPSGMLLYTCRYWIDGVNFNTTVNPWKPAVVSDLKPFKKGALRMMDAGMTNRNNVSKWADRRHKGDADQTPDWSPAGSKGIAYEWMVLLCNEIGINCWVNVPCHTVFAADGLDTLPDYSLRMALLIKTGVDMGEIDLTPLMPKLSTMTAAALVAAGGKQTGVALAKGLRLHVELGNEMWWEPECKNNSVTQGKAIGLPDMSGNMHNSWYAFAQLQVIRAFEAVFGVESNTVYRQFSGQAGNTWLAGNTGPHMFVLDSSKYNPTNIKIEGYAIAPCVKLAQHHHLSLNTARRTAGLIVATRSSVCCRHALLRGYSRVRNRIRHFALAYTHTHIHTHTHTQVLGRPGNVTRCQVDSTGGCIVCRVSQDACAERHRAHRVRGRAWHGG